MKGYVFGWLSKINHMKIFSCQKRYCQEVILSNSSFWVVSLGHQSARKTHEMFTFLHKNELVRVTLTSTFWAQNPLRTP